MVLATLQHFAISKKPQSGQTRDFKSKLGFPGHMVEGQDDDILELRLLKHPRWTPSRVWAPFLATYTFSVANWQPRPTKGSRVPFFRRWETHKYLLKMGGYK
ncbi:hypothetical protein PIB30_081309, partial [Stylosanthes scabra]|nr:hypothetical protein [Stylosanthes scabra]